MRELLGILIIAGLVVSIGGAIMSGAHAATGTSSDQEVIKALNIQNQQLKRIADSLAIISGQQPGWKLPK